MFRFFIYWAYTGMGHGHPGTLLVARYVPKEVGACSGTGASTAAWYERWLGNGLFKMIYTIYTMKNGDSIGL